MRKIEALLYLQNLERFGTQLGLERISLLLSKLGSPERELKAIHVAGTNGKGSVCAMVNTILQEAGYKVGLYTSPHLVDFKERFLINNKKISNSEVIRQVEILRPFAEEIKENFGQPTYFEVTTAAAFNYFAEQNIDYAVIETGLGGRLDATNVINPLVSVITNIDYEHTEYLGNTLEKIAFEKAGIIKQNKPTLTAANEPALNVIKKICAERNSKLIVANKKYNKKLNLRGEFQKINAGLAVRAVKELNPEIKADIIENALEKVDWPARLDLRKIKGKQILLDSAHHPACIRTIIPEFKNFDYKKLRAVVGILQDKDYATMLNQLNSIVDEYILANPKTDRAQTSEILSQYVNKNYKIIENTAEAVKEAINFSDKDDLILITGSMYVVGEAMKALG